MDHKSRFAQKYSTSLLRVSLRHAPLGRRAALLYDRRGAPLQTPPWPGNLPHASASVSYIGSETTLGFVYGFLPPLPPGV
jgi:hypothetical protein